MYDVIDCIVIYIMQVTWCNYKRTSINPVKIMKCLCQAKIILYVMIQLHETIPVTFFYIKDNMNEFKWLIYQGLMIPLPYQLHGLEG